MKLTLDDILKKMKEKEVPYGAICSDYNPKRLVWGADGILEALFINELDWIYFTADNLNYEEFAKLCERLENDERVVVYRLYTQPGHNNGHYWLKFLGDESLKNEIELLGGLMNYAKIGG